MKRLTNIVAIVLCCLFVLLLIAGIFAYSFATVLGTLTKPFQSVPADEQATDREEGGVDVGRFS